MNEGRTNLDKKEKLHIRKYFGNFKYVINQESVFFPFQIQLYLNFILETSLKLHAQFLAQNINDEN